MTFISGAYMSGAHFVINRAWALHHKLGQSELLTGTQLRHPELLFTSHMIFQGPGSRFPNHQSLCAQKPQLYRNPHSALLAWKWRCDPNASANASLKVGAHHPQTLPKLPSLPCQVSNPRVSGCAECPIQKRLCPRESGPRQSTQTLSLFPQTSVAPGASSVSI